MTDPHLLALEQRLTQLQQAYTSAQALADEQRQVADRLRKELDQEHSKEAFVAIARRLNDYLQRYQVKAGEPVDDAVIGVIETLEERIEEHGRGCAFWEQAAREHMEGADRLAAAIRAFLPTIHGDGNGRCWCGAKEADQLRAAIGE